MICNYSGGSRRGSEGSLEPPKIISFSWGMSRKIRECVSVKMLDDGDRNDLEFKFYSAQKKICTFPNLG